MGRDKLDLLKLISWFKVRNPFNLKTKNLFLPIYGPGASKNTDREKSLTVGLRSTKRIENLGQRDIQFKRSNIKALLISISLN